jgi:hypothetical protein
MTQTKFKAFKAAVQNLTPKQREILLNELSAHNGRNGTHTSKPKKLPSAADGFREGWKDMLAGRTITLDKLYDNLGWTKNEKSA